MLTSHSAPLLLGATRVLAQWLLVVPAALTAWGVWRNRSSAYEAGLGAILTIALVKISGAFYDHARPFVVFHQSPLIWHAADNAFPSDHLAASGLAFAYLWTKNRGLALVVAVCSLLIAAARVLAGLHWPVDVTVGFLLGVMAVLMARLVIHVCVREAG